MWFFIKSKLDFSALSALCCSCLLIVTSYFSAFLYIDVFILFLLSYQRFFIFIHVFVRKIEKYLFVVLSTVLTVTCISDQTMWKLWAGGRKLSAITIKMQILGICVVEFTEMCMWNCWITIKLAFVITHNGHCNLWCQTMTYVYWNFLIREEITDLVLITVWYKRPEEWGAVQILWCFPSVESVSWDQNKYIHLRQCRLNRECVFFIHQLAVDFLRTE